MRVLILILTLILTAQISSAQKLQRAFDMIYKGGDTLAAQKILKKSLKKHREIYAAYYGLGLCAMSSNPKEAFNIFKKVDAKFRISAKDFKKYMLVNYGITRDSAVYKINEIAAAQLRRTIMKDSSDILHNFFLICQVGIVHNRIPVNRQGAISLDIQIAANFHRS